MLRYEYEPNGGLSIFFKINVSGNIYVFKLASIDF